MVVVWFSAQPNIDLYFDGVSQTLSGDTTWSTSNNYECLAWAGEMGFGMIWTDKDPKPPDMLLDEVKIYDYPMSALQAGVVYNEYQIYGTGP